jgi:hypothetical protein
MTKFQHMHELEFALEVHEREPRSNEVTSVACKL